MLVSEIVSGGISEGVERRMKKRSKENQHHERLGKLSAGAQGKASVFVPVTLNRLRKE